MKITMLLPLLSPTPVGICKVIYEHANQLVLRGHDVVVLHRYWPGLGPRATGQISRLVSWFPLHPGVGLAVVPDYSERWIRDADAIIATTVEWAEPLPQFADAKGTRYYYIQDYDFFYIQDHGSFVAGAPTLPERMAAAFAGNLLRIAFSPAVVSMLEQCHATADAYIPCGLDDGVFRLERPVDAASRRSIGFPSRRAHRKGTEDAIAALERVRQRIDGPLDVWCFGDHRFPSMPGWITFHEQPSDRELCSLYNASSIFVLPSHIEGFGLPGMEAMACGAALVSTDNGGVRAYAMQGVSALLSPPRDVEALAGNILRLLRDPGARIALATRGHADVAAFSAQRATDLLEEFLINTATGRDPAAEEGRRSEQQRRREERP